MVRPVRPDEKDDNDFRYGDLDRLGGAGFMEGGSNFAATGGGQFGGDGQGTGFVNAQDYLTANKGKGLKLGEDVTKDAQGMTDSLNSGVTDFKNLQTPDFSAGDDPYANDVNNPFGTNVQIGVPTMSRLPGGASAEDTRSNGTIRVGGANSGRLKEAEDYYGANPHTYKGASSSTIKSKYDSLSDLKIKGDPLKSLYDPGTADARSLREQKLQEQADKMGASYGSGSKGFDAMFMESESPDLFQRKHDALDAALKNFSGLDSLRDEKISKADKATAEGSKYDQDMLAKSQAAYDRVKQREDAASREKPTQGELPPVDPNTDATVPPPRTSGANQPIDVYIPGDNGERGTTQTTGGGAQPVSQAPVEWKGSGTPSAPPAGQSADSGSWQAVYTKDPFNPSVMGTVKWYWVKK